MNKNLFILDDTYNTLIKSDGELNSLIQNDTDIIVGNYLFTIFKIGMDIDKTDYEIFSMNSNKKKENILKILNLTENNICYYDKKIYITEEFKNSLDCLLKNNYSEEYIKFIIESFQKKHFDIYDYIKKLDVRNFNKVYLDQFNFIKNINNETFYPINYCVKLQNEYHNKIAKEVLAHMFNLLKNLNYDIPPKLLDGNNEIYEDMNPEINNLHDLLINSLNRSDFSLFIRCINIFKLDYKNTDFIFILKNRENILDILKVIKESNIYDKKTYGELLLILNKVNLFANEKIENDDINYTDLIFYLNKYHADLSFYYILDKYFDKIKIDVVLSQDFTKIYLYFVKKTDKINTHICNYIKFILKNNANDKLLKILIHEFNKDTLLLSDIEEIIKILPKSLIKEILKFNDKIKYISIKPDFIFKILENKDEDLFYFIKNLFEEKEFNKIINELKDKEGNSIYHLMCKNNICLGYNINNKIRNNKGYRPLDLCQINHKYYKI